MTEPVDPIEALLLTAVSAAENAEVAFRDVYDGVKQQAYATDRVPAMLRAVARQVAPQIRRALETARPEPPSTGR